MPPAMAETIHVEAAVEVRPRSAATTACLVKSPRTPSVSEMLFDETPQAHLTHMVYHRLWPSTKRRPRADQRSHRSRSSGPTEARSSLNTRFTTSRIVWLAVPHRLSGWPFPPTRTWQSVDNEAASCPSQSRCGTQSSIREGQKLMSSDGSSRIPCRPEAAGGASQIRHLHDRSIWLDCV